MHYYLSLYKESKMNMKLIYWVGALAMLSATQFVEAHAIAGNRYFPGTITFDDPAVADELIIPAWARYSQPNYDDNVVDNSAAWAFARLLTPTTAIGIDGGYTHRNWGPEQTTGKTQVHVSVKTEVVRDEPDEFLAAASLAWGIGGSGSEKVGGNTPNTVAAGVYIGKGFGNLSDDWAAFRPFGITGAAVIETPVSNESVSNLTINPSTNSLYPTTTQKGTVLHWGFALEYSTLYLTDWFNGQPPSEEPLHQWVPLVEFAFDSSQGHKTTGTINPGISYVAQTWQIAIEAVRPLNDQYNHGIGVRAQLLLFLDDLLPSLFSNPVFHK